MGASGKPYIKWNAVANASQYKVYRSTSKNGTYTLLGTTTATHYTDNKAGSGYTYYYKVRAISKVKEHGEFCLQCSRGRYLPLRETDGEDHHFRRQAQTDLERCGRRQQVLYLPQHRGERNI